MSYNRDDIEKYVEWRHVWFFYETFGYFTVIYIINIPIQIRSGEMNEVNTTSIQILFYFFIPE